MTTLEDLSDLSDAELVIRLAQGQTPPLDTLVQRHYAPLLGYLTRVLADRPTAEDLAQETLLQVLRRSTTYRPDRSFKPWLYAIATNLARDFYRLAENRNVTDQELDEWVPEPRAGLETARIEGDDAEHIRRALNQLSLGLRSVIILRYYADLTVPEIAAALELPPDTVKSRLHTASRRLEAALRPLTVGGVPC